MGVTPLFGGAPWRREVLTPKGPFLRPQFFFCGGFSEQFGGGKLGVFPQDFISFKNWALYWGNPWGVFRKKASGGVIRAIRFGAQHSFPGGEVFSRKNRGGGGGAQAGGGTPLKMKGGETKESALWEFANKWPARRGHMGGKDK